MSIIARDIASARLDITGLQEVDMYTRRSGGIDSLSRIGEAGGFTQLRFARAIDYQGGEYGTAVISKYPITAFDVFRLDTGTHEGRSVSRAVIDIAGQSIAFFNTHLSYEDDTLRAGQFAFIADLLSRERNFILTGDFNTSDTAEFPELPGAALINDNNRYPTFPATQKGIDNIMISSGLEICDAGIVEGGHSDHNLLWTELKLKANF